MVLFKHYAKESRWPIFLAMCPACLMTLSAWVVPMFSRETQTRKKDFLVLKRVFAAPHWLLQCSCLDPTPVCEAGFEDQSPAGNLKAATRDAQALFEALQHVRGTELWKLPGEAEELSEQSIQPLKVARTEEGYVGDSEHHVEPCLSSQNPSGRRSPCIQTLTWVTKWHFTCARHFQVCIPNADWLRGMGTD